MCLSDKRQKATRLMDKRERCWPTQCIIDADAIFNRRGRKEHQEREEIFTTCGRYQKCQDAKFSHPRLISKEFVTVIWIIRRNRLSYSINNPNLVHFSNLPGDLRETA